MQMYKYATNLTNVAKRPQSGAKCTKKTTGPTGPTSGGGRWAGSGLVSGGWGPKVGSPALICRDRCRPPVNIAACNF